MNVALTGFMGAGKTSTGRALARLLRVPFVDTDAEIERRHGPIPELFARHGEAHFRRCEAEVIAEYAAAQASVIAVGGGAVLEEANRRKLRERGVIVHLAVTPQTAYRRVLRRRHRPLLGPVPQLDAVRSLLSARAAAYADNDLTIHVDHRRPEAAARIIARWVNDRSGAAAR